MKAGEALVVLVLLVNNRGVTMLSRYELIIKVFADIASKDGITFTYDGRSVDGESISLLFSEAIIKRALKKLVLCVSKNTLEIDKYKALNDVKNVTEPLHSKILDDEYIYSEISEEDLSVIKALDEKTLFNWIIYVMKNELFPMAFKLEGWNEMPENKVTQ